MMNNNTYIESNKYFFNTILNEYPNLQGVSFDNNRLLFKDYMVDISGFDLKELKTETFLLSPYMFINIIKIHMDVLDELKYLLANNYNTNFLYFEIRTILVKKVLVNDDDIILNRFIDAYLELNNYQDYLIGEAKNKYLAMQSVIRDSLFADDSTLSTPGAVILMDALNNFNAGISNSRGPVLALTNPNFPSTINEEAQIPKSGFASIFLLIYIITNIGFIIAVSLLSK